MIRLRFAPSPTGYLHAGNIYTALRNYLMARKSKGQFILRIDDTDHSRSKQEYVDALQEDLLWLGLHWDILDFQSHHMDEYRQAAEKLKSSGRLYACYETPEELQIMRKSLLSRGKPPIYNRQALQLTSADHERLQSEGKMPHWRFKLSDDAVIWNDLIRGEVRIDTTNISDPVLIRENGDPVYLLCTAVDDVRHGITHIFRGEDHVTNTSINIQLLEALGVNPQQFQFAHFPLIADISGEGFSKRNDSFRIRTLREQGFEPMAINSILGTIGTAEAMHPHMSMDTLIQSFDITKFSKSTAKFNLEDVDIINRKIVHQLKFDDVKDRLKEYPQVNEIFWNAVHTNLDRVQDIQHWVKSCLSPIQPIITDKEFLELAANILKETPWTEHVWTEWINKVKEKSGRKGKELFKPIRLALTGEEHGPELKDLFMLIGAERVIARDRKSVV